MLFPMIMNPKNTLPKTLLKNFSRQETGGIFMLKFVINRCY